MAIGFSHCDSQSASASAELLATLTALWAFGHLQKSNTPHQIPVTLPAATDNRGNQFLLKKQSTTRWPLLLVNIQLSHLLRLSRLRLNLTWKPRSENELADQLTNDIFSSFSSERRISFNFEDLPLDLLCELWETKAQFDRERKRVQLTPQQGPSKRKAERTPW